MKEYKNSAEIAESMIRDVLRLRPDLTVDDLVLECHQDGSMAVVLKPQNQGNASSTTS